MLSLSMSAIGKKYFITTPNKWFPFEPHYRLPLFQFAPKIIQKLICKLLLRGEFGDINLLSYRQLGKLFPKARIKKHKVTIYPETLIAIKGDE